MATAERVSRSSTPLAQAQAHVQKTLSEEDVWIIDCRESGKKWKDVLALWKKNGGKDLTHNALQMRYRRAKEFLKESNTLPHRPEPPKETLLDVARAWKPPVAKKPAPVSNETASHRKIVRYEPGDDDSAGPANSPNFGGSDSHRTGNLRVSEQLDQLTLDTQPSTAAGTTHPTTGGKYYNVDAFKAYLAGLGPDDSDDEQSDREPSPITEDDAYHWRYHVKRKAWMDDEDEEDVEWFVVDGETSYSTLREAEIAAGQEACRHRQGVGLGQDVRRWSFERDQNDLPQYAGSSRDGHFMIIVDRFLCNASSGQLPESKLGWISKRGWDIMRQTTTKISKPAEDDLFDEKEEKETTEVELVDGIYTVLGEANKVASKMVLAMTNPKSRRMEAQLKNIEAENRMREHLRMLEEAEEIFHDMVKVNETETVEIWVEEREIKGPRNI